MKLEQYTVRIYDTSLSNKIDEIFKKCQSLYSTKNPFIADCILRGVEAIEKDLFGEKKIQNFKELFDEIRLTIEKLEKLTKLCERNTKDILANLEINQKLLSCNYNLLMGISDDNPKKKDFVEAGLFDDLPERLVNYLEDILKSNLK